MNDSIGIGVLGLGRMGQVHCRLISDCPGLELVAGSSGSEELRHESAANFDAKFYHTHDELLQDPRVEWVVVATTTNRHKPWALKAIDAGKNLIIEKPVALTFEEAEEIFAAAQGKNVLATVYNSRRWDADFQFVQRTLASGTLGDVYRIESRYTDFDAGWGAWGAQGDKNPWRLMKDFGGGILNDWGPHLFDQIFLLVDSSLSTVLAKLYSRIWSEQVDDHFWSELLFKGGVSVLIEASNNYRIAQSRWCVVGTEGTLWVKGGSPDAWGPMIIRQSSRNGIEEFNQELPHLELSSGFYRDFLKALRAGDPLPVQPAQVLKVMKLIETVRESNGSGKSLPFTCPRQ